MQGFKAQTQRFAELELARQAAAPGGFRACQGRPSRDHLRAAAEELKRLGQEEDAAAEAAEAAGAAGAAEETSPWVLAATNVRASWTWPHELYTLRPLLVDGNLFITQVPGNPHGRMQAKIGSQLDNYACGGPPGVLAAETAVNQRISNITIEPDVALTPQYPAPGAPPDNDPLTNQPIPRVVVEVEVSHRSAPGLRTHGALILSRAYTVAFLAIKIYGDGHRVAAVLYIKDAAGHIQVRQAMDVGASPLTAQAKGPWERVYGPGVALPPSAAAVLPPGANVLPGVNEPVVAGRPANGSWTRMDARTAVGGPPPTVTIAGALIYAQVHDRHGAAVSPPGAPPPNDCHIDLRAVMASAYPLIYA